jgi:hypothetical protein
MKFPRASEPLGPGAPTPISCMHQRLKDIGLGVGIIGFFLFTLFVLIPAEIFVPSSIKYRALSPAFFPRIVSILMVFLGTILILQSFLITSRPTKEGEKEPESASDEEEIEALSRRPTKGKVIRIGAGAGLMFLYYGLIHIFGIVLTSIFMMPLFIWLYDERRWKLMFPLSVLLAFSLYYFFAKVALISLPKGSLFQ